MWKYEFPKGINRGFMYGEFAICRSFLNRNFSTYNLLKYSDTMENLFFKSYKMFKIILLLLDEASIRRAFAVSDPSSNSNRRLIFFCRI